MTVVKVEGNNTFEWKIHIVDLDGRTVIWSGQFFVDDYEFELIYVYKYRGCQTLSQFRLYYYSIENFPVFYTFNILDRKGRVFVTSKGKVVSNGSEEVRSLMIIDASYFNDWNLIENGELTVRFSLSLDLDAQEGSYPTKGRAPNVADSTTNTNPHVTKDSSTNTNSRVTEESSTNTDEEDTSLLEILSNDFSTFYENKTDTDCVLKVSDDQFNVHRAVLSARSSVFSAMFHHDTAENRSGEVNIPDIKAKALSDVLYYVYSGKIRGLTADTAASMYTVADKYDLPELRANCFEFLKCNLTMDNFCEAALLAHTHGEMELEERVVWFIDEKLDEVLESSTWQQFLKDKTLLASKLLTSGYKASKAEQSRNTTSK